MRGPRSSNGALRVGGGPSASAPSGLGTLTKYAPAPLFGWEAAAAGVADLSTLTDSYGGSLTLTQATSSKRASNSGTKINGRTPLTFAGGSATEYAKTSGGVTGNADHAMLVAWKSADNASNYAAIASMGPSGGNTSALGKHGSARWFGGSGFVSPEGNNNAGDGQDDLAWHILTKRHASGKDYFFADGRPLLSNSAGLVPNPFTQTYSITSAAFGLGTPWSAGYPCPSGDLAAALWYGAITAANVQIVERYLALRFGLAKPPQIVCDGDSLTLGSYSDASHIVANPYPSQLAALLGMTLDVTNLGIFGQTVATMLTNEAGKVLPMWSSIRGVRSPTSTPRNTAILWGGTNDGNGGDDAPTIYGRISSYATAAKAAGYRMIVVTPIRRTTSAPLNAILSALRDLIVAGAASFDGVVDLWPQPEFADTTNPAIYAADGTHLVQAGYDAVARYVAAVARGIV